MMVSIWGLTDRGIVRSNNQDSYAYEVTEGGTWGVVCEIGRASCRERV